MKKSKQYRIITPICIIAAAGIFYLIGYQTARSRYENTQTALDIQTFYAIISDIQENHLEVKGMDVNDINFRGDFTFSVSERTRIVWRYTDINLKDLDVGDRIAVTFSGEIMESDPAQIAQVEQLQLLEDEC